MWIFQPISPGRSKGTQSMKFSLKWPKTSSATSYLAESDINSLRRKIRSSQSSKSLGRRESVKVSDQYRFFPYLFQCFLLQVTDNLTQTGLKLKAHFLVLINGGLVQSAFQVRFDLVLHLCNQGHRIFFFSYLCFHRVSIILKLQRKVNFPCAHKMPASRTRGFPTSLSTDMRIEDFPFLSHQTKALSFT